MKRIIKAFSVFTALLIALSFSGCIKYVALDEYGYVMTIGVDEGETYAYRFCFIVQVEGAKGESDAENVVLSAEGDNIYDAVTLIEVGVPYLLNFGRTNYILFSRSVAQSGYIAGFIDESVKNLGVRRSTKLMVILDECIDYCMGVISKDYPNTSKRQYSILREYTSEGITPITNIASFTQNVLAKRADSIVTLGATDDSIANEEITGSSQDNAVDPFGTTNGVERTGGLRSYYTGCAVFDGGIMTGVLNGRDTEIILMAKGDFSSGRISFDSDAGNMVLLMKSGGEPKVELTLGERPHVHMEIKLQCSIESGGEDMSYDEWSQNVKPMIENYMERELERVFYRCRELNSDAYGLGRYAVVRFTDTDEWESYDWKSKYKLLEAEFNVELYIENEEINSIGG